MTRDKTMSAVSDDLVEFARWKGGIDGAIRRFERWCEASGLNDQAIQARTRAIHDRLSRRGVSVAFVAEFSRGKSELINALFFAGFGERIVPSSAGRTTMCPTELFWDPARPCGIRLLPIETRSQARSLADFRAEEGVWHEIRFDAESAHQVKAALSCVQEQIPVDPARAEELGLLDEDGLAQARQGGSDRVLIPKWRHALVNFPHPLLQAGLSIIDTPGLNAIGTEPELTLRMIPEADAVLFLLAADTGVTRSDIEVWREHIATSRQTGRFAVLNKIDGLWDDLRSHAEIDAEIGKQVQGVARDLGLDETAVFPVSAQKALNAKIHQDPALLARSRIAALEVALSEVLVRQHRDILTENLQHEFREAVRNLDGSLQSRHRNQVEQLFELNGLRGKNREVMNHTAARIRGERDEFEKSLRRLHGLRAVFQRHGEVVGRALSIDSLKSHVRHSRELMKSSNFSTGLKQGMNSLLTKAAADMARAEVAIQEVTTLMTAMYRTFSVEHGLTLGSPMLFSLSRHQDELSRLSTLSNQRFGAIALATTEKHMVMRQFLESITTRLREIHAAAARDAHSWLRAVMAPIEGQVREHQAQLKRRMESVRRILEANDTLDERIQEIRALKEDVEERLKGLNRLKQEFVQALEDLPKQAPAPAVGLEADTLARLLDAGLEGLDEEPLHSAHAEASLP